MKTWRRICYSTGILEYRYPSVEKYTVLFKVQGTLGVGFCSNPGGLQVPGRRSRPTTTPKTRMTRPAPRQGREHSVYRYPARTTKSVDPCNYFYLSSTRATNILGCIAEDPGLDILLGRRSST